MYTHGNGRAFYSCVDLDECLCEHGAKRIGSLMLDEAEVLAAYNEAVWQT